MTAIENLKRFFIYDNITLTDMQVADLIISELTALRAENKYLQRDKEDYWFLIRKLADNKKESE